jgi:hypothetical protein
MAVANTVVILNSTTPLGLGQMNERLVSVREWINVPVACVPYDGFETKSSTTWRLTIHASLEPDQHATLQEKLREQKLSVQKGGKGRAAE